MTDDRKIDFATEIPKLPGSVMSCTEIRKALEDPDVTAARVTDILGRDALLAARVLKLANSPFYSLGKEISSLKQAVIILGNRMLGHVVLGAAMEILASSNILKAPVDAQRYWHHSVAAAYLAKLARREQEDADEAFTFGLLHDIGMILMALKFGRIYLSYLSRFGDLDVEREDKMFRTTHAHAGAFLFKLWRLPPGLVEGVLIHHDESSNHWFREVEEVLVTLGLGIIPPASAELPETVTLGGQEFNAAELREELENQILHFRQ